jgi:hypothetical protein
MKRARRELLNYLDKGILEETPRCGDIVRVKRGAPGEGFTFRCTDTDSQGNVYGKTWAGVTYGPRRRSEVEIVKRLA